MLYVLVSIAAAIYLSKKLRGGNFSQFKKVLGGTYLFKPMINGTTKYKWYYLWLTIKAEFDNEGQLPGKFELYFIPKIITGKLKQLNPPTPGINAVVKQQAGLPGAIRQAVPEENLSKK